MMRSLRFARRWFTRIAPPVVWGFTGIITLILLFSYALPQNMARRSEPYATLVCVSFFGRVLTFHFGLVLFFIAIVAIPLRRIRLLLVSTALSIICLFPTLVSLWPHDEPAVTGPTMRVMSMNLKYTQSHAEKICDQILKYKPDVLVLEDYTPFAQSEIEKLVGNLYPNREFYFNYFQGLAIYSRLPFDGEARTSFTITHRQIRIEVWFHSRPIAIYVEHPYSPRSKQRILNNRMATLDLAGQIRKETIPVIAAGDFNFTETTPNESALKLVGLADAFEQAGHGRGSTWPVAPTWKQWLPGVRIDHIFSSRELTCTWFEVGQYDGSDHLPIVADIAIRN